MPSGKNLHAIAAMVASQLALVSNDALIKLASDSLPMGEIVFIRGVFCTLLFGSAVLALGLHRQIPGLLNWKVTGRLVGEVGGTFFYLVALFHMAIANVIIIFQAVPLTVAAGAAVLLGEQVSWRKWLAIVLGFMGVLLVVRPGLAGFDVYGLFVLVSVAFIAGRDLCTRAMPTNLPIVLVAGLTALSVTVLGVVMGLGEDWVWPTPLVFLHLAGAAVLLAVGYFMIIAAMRLGDIAATAPFRYVTVLFAIAIGFWIWGDVPDELTLVGSAIIVGAGLYTLYSERGRSSGPAALVPAAATVPRRPD